MRGITSVAAPLVTANFFSELEVSSSLTSLKKFRCVWRHRNFVQTRPPGADPVSYLFGRFCRTTKENSGPEVNIRLCQKGWSEFLTCFGQTKALPSEGSGYSRINKIKQIPHNVSCCGACRISMMTSLSSSVKYLTYTIEWCYISTKYPKH